LIRYATPHGIQHISGLQLLWSHLVSFLKWSQELPYHKLKIDAKTLPFLHII
jgi:hypothetical protein